MQEVKKPSKRPLVFYYLIGMLILMVLNMTFSRLCWKSRFRR